MPAPLTPAGEAAVAELAQRFRVSDGAVRSLLTAVVRGGGAMAQFSHPDLGGSGQWMRGGMTMVGDMFNPALQATVSGICTELSAQLAGGTALVEQTQRAGSGLSAGTSSRWWPEDLGRPSSSGGQNDASYAYFPSSRRLAIKRGAAITVYDTGDHAIAGVQQQQGGRGSLEFSSQHGTFTVSTLPLVSGGADVTPPPAASPAAQQQSTSRPAGPDGARSTAAEIGAAIETLAGLRDKGFLTDDEFTVKKTELLARL